MIDKASEKSFRRILDEWQACEAYLLSKEKAKDDVFMDQDNDTSSLESKGAIFDYITKKIIV